MKVSRFLIVPERPVSIQKLSESVVRKPAVAGGVRSSRQSNGCLQTTVSRQIMVLICSYLLINLVLCILLCV